LNLTVLKSEFEVGETLTWPAGLAVPDRSKRLDMEKSRSPHSLRKRTVKRRYRLFMLTEASHPLYRVSGLEILGVLALVLTVVWFF
jgi:hypothetical protein